MKNKTAKYFNHLITVALICISTLFLSYSAGITGRTTAPGHTPGCQCHNVSGPFGISIYIDASPIDPYNRSSMVTIEIPCNSNQRAGINVKAGIGSVWSPIANTVGKEVTHFSPMAPNSRGVAMVGLYYRAPNYECRDTLHITFMVCNNNGIADESDLWAYEKKVIYVSSPTNIDKLPSVKPEISRMYPNPCTDAINLNLEISEETQVMALVYNSAGEVIEIPVRNLLPAGKHILKVNTAHYSRGVYYFTVSTGKKSTTQKFVVS